MKFVDDDDDDDNDHDINYSSIALCRIYRLISYCI